MRFPRTALFWLIPVLLLPGLHAQDRRAPSLFLEADRLLEEGRFEAALARFQTLVTRFPLDSSAGRAWLKILSLQARLGAWDEIPGAVRTLEQRYPEASAWPEPPFWEAWALQRKGNSAEALASYQKALDRSPDPGLEILIRRQRSGLLTRAQRFSEAWQEFQAWEALEPEGWTQDPESVLAWAESARSQLGPRAIADRLGELGPFPPAARGLLSLMRARLLAEDGRRAESLELLRSLDQEATELRLRALVEMVPLLEAQGLLEESQQRLTEARPWLAEYPQIALTLWWRLAWSQQRQGQGTAARDALAQIEALSAQGLVPSADSEFWFVYFTVMESQAQSQRALEFWRRCHPSEAAWPPGALKRVAALEYRLERLPEAARLWESLAATDPESAYLAARAWHEAGQSPRSLPLLSGLRTWPSEVRSRAQLLQALVLDRLNRPSEALESLNLYLAGASDDLPARLLRWEWLARAGRFADLQTFPRDLSVWPGDLRPRAELLNVLLDLRSARFDSALGRALPLWTQPGLLSPRSRGLAGYYAAYAQTRLGRWNEALELWPRVLAGIEEASLQISARFWQAWSLMGAARWAEAVTAWTALIDLNPAFEEKERLGFYRARSLAAAGRIPQAVESLQAWGRRYPGQAAEAAFESARLQAEAATQLEDQLPHWNDFLRAFPRAGTWSEDARLRLAESLVSLNRWTQAASAWETFLREYPRHAQADRARFWLGQSRENQNDPYGALLAYQALVSPQGSLGPFGVQALYRIGEVHSRLGQWEAALEAWNRLADLDPAQARAWGLDNRRQQARLILSGAGTEEAELRTALTRAGGVSTPAGRRVALDLAALLAVQDPRTWEEAEKILRDVETAGEAALRPRLQFLRADLLDRRGQMQEALRTFLEVPRLQPVEEVWAAQSLFRAIDLLISLGGRTQAQTLRTTLETAFPRSEWTARARARLETNP